MQILEVSRRDMMNEWEDQDVGSCALWMVEPIMQRLYMLHGKEAGWPLAVLEYYKLVTFLFLRDVPAHNIPNPAPSCYLRSRKCIRTS